MTAILSCDPKVIFYCHQIVDHLQRELHAGFKGSERVGSNYEFLKEHGFKLTLEALDGTPVPEAIAERLKFEVVKPVYKKRTKEQQEKIKYKYERKTAVKEGPSLDVFEQRRLKRAKVRLEKTKAMIDTLTDKKKTDDACPETSIASSSDTRDTTSTKSESCEAS